MIFVNSISDTFHEKVPGIFVNAMYDTIMNCPQHTFQIITKRPNRMFEWHTKSILIKNNPLPNFWLGVTAEIQQFADERIPILLDIPAAVRFVSLEPLLEDIYIMSSDFKKLDWVIVGCESGTKRRECKIEWIESIVDQCAEAGFPCFVKAVAINGRVSKNPDEWPASVRVRQWPGKIQ
jgi:protein gp37